MTTGRRGRTRRARQGVILIVTMVLVFVLAALVIGLGQSVRVDLAVAANAAAGRAAAAVGRGAEQYVLAALAQAAESPEVLDPAYFEQIAVGGGYFWVVRPGYGEADSPAFGLVDESAKVDLNRAGVERLRRLPGMTDELAAAIVDWRDADDEPTEGGGAEADAYADRDPPYAPRNAPFKTIEELLLVEGVTPALLYGDPAAGGAGEPYQAIGLAPYLTAWADPAPPASGGELLDLNDDDARGEVRDMLEEVFGDERGDELADRAPRNDVADVFDFARRVEMTSDELAQILDRVRVGEGNPARLNVNAAPRAVLLTLDGLDEGQVDALIAARANRPADRPYSWAWVMDALGEESVGLGQQLTGRGRYASAEVVAASGDGRAFRRVRIIVDTGGSAGAGPRVVYRRDLTDAGWPLDPEVLRALREGGEPAAVEGF